MSQMMFPCQQCNKSFPTSFTLSIHERWHTIDNPHVCEHCGKRFPAPSSLKRHMSCHIGGHQYLCSQCGKTFVCLSNLTWHQGVHAPSRKVTSCLQSSLYCMRVHLRIHTKERRIRCTLWDKAFTKVGYLNVHLLSHTNERPFSCGVCGKIFMLAQHLKVLQMIPTHKLDTNWKRNVSDNGDSGVSTGISSV